MAIVSRTTHKHGPDDDGPEDAIPPLETGDRLSRAEFERRYRAMPGLKRAELIEGVVYIPSPVGLRRHGGPHFELITWLGAYKAAAPGVIGADNASTRLDLDNEPQPDAVLLIDPASGGQARLSPDDDVEDAPELVAEVASNSVSYDLTDKLKVYRRNGVCEYVVWRVLDRQVDWFVLREGDYVRLPLDPSGVYRSEVFPGLWLDPLALVGGDMAAVLAVTQSGLANPEHAAFVARLNAQPKS
jgi:Uma2 family endonuclease